jgi:hypothetical protein
MQTYDPNTFAPSLALAHRQWVQSTNDVVNGGIEIGTPAANSPSATTGVNAGVPTQYERANGSGVMIRIDANGVTNTGASYNWGATSTGIAIKHGLQRVPIGFHVVDQDGSIQVYRTAPPTDQVITLAPSDNTKSVTVYIF